MLKDNFKKTILEIKTIRTTKQQEEAQKKRHIERGKNNIKKALEAITKVRFDERLISKALT